MSPSSLAVVVLCAGKGTRMKSEKAKVLHPLLGKPMCFYPFARAVELNASKLVAVVGHQAADVEDTLKSLFPSAPLLFALQAEQKGTGHAVRCAEEALAGFEGPVMILYGDVPLLTTHMLQRLLSAYHASSAGLSMVTTFPKNPLGYGRVLRDGGRVTKVVEQKDATEAQKAITECNAGIYVANSTFLFEALRGLKASNAQQEYYLTDVVEKAALRGTIETVVADFEETAGVNDLAELAERANILRARINNLHMKNGVTLLHPETTFIDEGVTIGMNTVIGPMVSISSECVVGNNVKIGQGSVLSKTQVADGTEIKPYSVFEEAVVGKACVIGPFSRLRPGTELAEGVHLGNFVETKKARIGRGSKANHLAYLGDADIGSGVNVGAGTITCNYDGVKKHVTVLEDGVFIGSDSQLVAPVTVGQGAYIGAGSTITKNVPPGSLAVSRTPQVVKEGWAARKKKSG